MPRGRRSTQGGARSRYGGKSTGALTPTSPSVSSSPQLSGAQNAFPLAQQATTSKRGNGGKRSKGRQSGRPDGGWHSKEPKLGKGKRAVGVDSNSSTHRLNFERGAGQLHEDLALYSERREGDRGRGIADYAPYNSAYNLYYAPKPQQRAKPFSSDHYVSANFRFVVKSQSACLHWMPADSHQVRGNDQVSIMNWDDVIQVIYPTSSHPACPFCLSQPPIAPRITKCGHVYCLPCIQRFFHIYEPSKNASTGEITHRTNFRECPICHQLVYLNDFKPVRFWEGLDYRKQKEMTFTLMKRSKSSYVSASFAMPADDFDENRSLSTGDPCAVKYARIMAEATGYQLEQIWMPDFAALLQEEGMDAEEELILEMARSQVQNAMDELQKPPTEEAANEKTAFDLEGGNDTGGSSRNESSSTGIGTLSDTVHTISLDSRPSSPTLHVPGTSDCNETTGRPSPPQSKWHGPAKRRHGDQSSYVYFYQAKDGQPVFLEQIHVKMLGKEFGPFSNWPKELTLPIEATTPSVITFGLLKQHSYLSHLPNGSEIVFAEVDLSGVIKDSTMDMFRESLDKRREKREEQTRLEDKALEDAQKDRFGLGISVHQFQKLAEDDSDHSSLDEPMPSSFPSAPIWPIVNLPPSPTRHMSLSDEMDFPSMSSAALPVQRAPKWGAGTASFAQVINRPKQSHPSPSDSEESAKRTV